MGGNIDEIGYGIAHWERGDVSPAPSFGVANFPWFR